MYRRDFLVALGFLTISSKALYEAFTKLYYKRILGKIYYDLPSYIYVAETTFIVDGEEYGVKIKGRGIIIGNKYITAAHILRGFDSLAPWYGEPVPLNVEKRITTLKGIVLKPCILDFDTDVAVFQIPNYLNLAEFPCEPSNEINLGDEVYIIGNPYISGDNVRRAYVCDLDRISKPSPIGIVAFGIDTPLLPFESGSPVVNKDFKLIGIASSTYAESIGYANRIISFL